MLPIDMPAEVVLDPSGAVGRFVVAKREIDKGETICVTDSYAIGTNSVLALMQRMCENCGYKLPADNADGTIVSDHDETGAEIVFCSKCGSERYRDSSVGEHSIRRYWCNSESLTEYEDDFMPEQASLALRVLLRALYYTEVEESIGDPFELVGEEGDCDDARLYLAERLASMAEIYGNNNHPASVQVKEALTLMNLKRMMGIIHRNAFKVADGVITLFPRASLFNHSCAPNAIMTVEYAVNEGVPGTAPLDIRKLPYRYLRATIRSLEKIRQGDEISISYVPLSLYPKSYRQQAIYDRHFFQCGCRACRADVGEDVLLEQTVSQMGDMVLSIEPLVQVLDGVEEELASGEDCDYDDLELMITNAHAGMDNLGLGDLHFLRLKSLVLLTEINFTTKRFERVLQFCQDWLGCLDRKDGQGAASICDVHLKCRMLVLNAESLVELIKTGSASTTSSSISGMDTLNCKHWLNTAIDFAILIYGDDYSLVNNLRRQLTEIQELLARTRPG